jgi:hypothetical protein
MGTESEIICLESLHAVQILMICPDLTLVISVMHLFFPGPRQDTRRVDGLAEESQAVKSTRLLSCAGRQSSVKRELRRGMHDQSPHRGLSGSPLCTCNRIAQQPRA